jgi:hypothetical protein
MKVLFEQQQAQVAGGFVPVVAVAVPALAGAGTAIANAVTQVFIAVGLSSFMFASITKRSAKS